MRLTNPVAGEECVVTLPRSLRSRLFSSPAGYSFPLPLALIAPVFVTYPLVAPDAPLWQSCAMLAAGLAMAWLAVAAAATQTVLEGRLLTTSLFGRSMLTIDLDASGPAFESPALRGRAVIVIRDPVVVQTGLPTRRRGCWLWTSCGIGARRRALWLELLNDERANGSR